MPDPVENMWLYTNASGFNDWNSTESTSRSNGHDNVYASNPEVLGHVWPSSSSSSSQNYLPADPRTDEREFDYSNGLPHENCRNAYGIIHPIGRAAMRHSSPNIALESSNLAGGPGPYHNFIGIDNPGTSSYDFGSFLRNRYDPDSFPNTWGFACKRKALDVSSFNPFSSGCSSSNPQAESSSRNSTGSRFLACHEFQSSSAQGTAENPTINFGIIENFGFHLLPERTSEHFPSSPNLWDSLSLSLNPTNHYSSMNSPMMQEEAGFRNSFTNNGAISTHVNWARDIARSSQNQPSCFGIGPLYHTQSLFPSSRDANHSQADSGGSHGGRGREHFLYWQPRAPTSSESPARGNHQPYLWPSMTVEAPGDSRGLVSEGRNRLESEVHPMFMDEVEEVYDVHRDLRLDVDNMSYEELLALEEHIGNVNTGLSEFTILRHMKQRKYFCFFEGLSPDLEPCCICQEEYINADDIGTLKCGHDFHSKCIKEWLMLKNLCPICKTTGLDT